MMAFGKAHLLAAFALALVVFAGTTHSIDFKDFGNMFAGTQVTQCLASPILSDKWIGLAWLSLAIGVFFVAGTMALSGVFSGQKYNEFVKGTLWGMVETAALLSIFTISFAGLSDYGAKNIDTARAYSAVIRNSLAFDFGLVMAGTTVFSFISRQAPQPKLPGLRAWGVSFQLSPMFRPIFDGLGLLVQMLAGAMAAWTGNEFLLCFIKGDMLTLILPLGFFLRAFGLRGGANALFGVAIALFFIYPIMLIAIGQMVSDYFVNAQVASDPSHLWASCLSGQPICCVPSNPIATLNEPFLPNGQNWADNSSNDRLKQLDVINGNIILSFDGLAPGATGSFCIFNTGLARTYSAFLPMLNALGAATLPAAAVTVAAANLLFLKYMNLSWIMVSLSPLLMIFLLSSVYEIVFFVFVVSLILPILVLFVCLTAAKEITKALGTEIDLSSLEKLI